MPEFAPVFSRVDTYLSGEDDKGYFIAPMIFEAMQDYSYALKDGNPKGKIYV